MKKQLGWALLPGLVFGFAREACAGFLYNGMSYMNFESYGGSTGAPLDYPDAIMSMQSAGVNTVALNVWDFTAGPTSTTIAPDYDQYSSSDAQVVAAIQDIHAAGMNVLLKPMLDLDDQIWRGVVNPSAANVTPWFTSYDSFIDHYATIAASNGVNLFSVGCELNGVEQYTSNWTSLISQVRGIYSAQGISAEKLTYAANWAANSVGRGGFENIPWWNSLDYIGIDAYFPLATMPDPSEGSLATAWDSYASQINQWRLSVGLGNEPVIFTEAGYAAVANTAENPTGNTSGIQDIPAQANAYQALLQAMAPDPWFDGSFFWNWQPQVPDSNDDSFDPQNKALTDSVLKSYYLPDPGGVGPGVFCGLIFLQARMRSSTAS